MRLHTGAVHLLTCSLPKAVDSSTHMKGEREKVRVCEREREGGRERDEEENFTSFTGPPSSDSSTSWRVPLVKNIFITKCREKVKWLPL